MEKKDFFISYRSKDKGWAEWIAWQLEEESYSVVVQAWDFLPGTSFIERMEKATKEARCTIAVLTPDYFDSPFTKVEWQSAYRKDPTGEHVSLLPVRVQPCEVKGLLGSIVYIDLVGLEENKAREKLIQGVIRERNKPSVAPPFPGRVSHSLNKPSFPLVSQPLKRKYLGIPKEKTPAIRESSRLPIQRSMANSNTNKSLESPVQEDYAVNNIEWDDSQAAFPSKQSWNGIVGPKILRASLLAKRGQSDSGTSSARSISLSNQWFRDREVKLMPWPVITIGLISIFILGLYILTLVRPHNAPILLEFFNQNTSTNTPIPQPVNQASQDLVQISQLDPAQYNSTQEYNTWSHADSSTAAMTEVINAYGHHYRVTDILKIEIQLNEISPNLGLLNDNGIALTVAKFGFKTVLGHNLSLSQIIDIANNGRPVIVSFPPSNYPGGHSLVVTGGSGNNVKVVDSFDPKQHTLTLGQFMHLWAGFSAIVTPN